MEVDWFTVIAQIFNFLLLVFLLKKFLYRPIIEAMDKREKSITQREETAQEKTEEASEQIEDYKRKIEKIDRKIKSVEDLRSIVSTMKALAATNIKRYEKTVISLDEYKRTVELGLRVVLNNRGEETRKTDDDLKGRRILVVFGSDHGMAGGFNERIVEFFQKVMKDELVDIDDHFVFAVGEQITSRLLTENVKIYENFRVPDTVESILIAVQDLIIKIEEYRQEHKDISRIDLYTNKPIKGENYIQAYSRLLPVDMEHLYSKKLDWEARSIPTFTIESDKLLTSLTGQYIFVRAYETFAFSLAAENSSRLSSMQAAEKNIDERIDELQALYRKERQVLITDELNDIISGFKAIKKNF